MPLYFTYGANMDRRIIKKRCPSSEFQGVARAPDYDLCFPRYSTRCKGGEASIEPSQGEEVWGALYDVPEEELSDMDWKEGVPYSYLREKIEVELPTGERAIAQTYIANKTGSFLPHRTYVQQLVRTARQLDIPEDYIAKIEKVTAAKGT